MKIIFISEYFPSSFNADIRGGVEGRVFYLIKQLKDTHEIKVIASHEQQKPHYQKLNNVEILRVGLTRLYTRTGGILSRIIFMLHATFTILKYDFDVVEGSSFLAWFPAFFASVIKRKPCVLVVADIAIEYIHQESPLLTFIIKWFEEWLLTRKNVHIVTISHTVSAKVVKLGIPANKITTIYCGVPLTEINQLPAKKNKHPSICCVARLVPYKHVDDLIIAVGNLTQKIPDLQLDIIGSGEEYAKLEQLIADMNLRKTVTLHNFVTKHLTVLRYLKRATVFCLPSWVEGFGIATIEALACQVPAVLVDLPIHHEVTEDYGVVYYTKQDLHTLQLQLQKLITNRKWYLKIKKQTATIIKKYDWKIIAHETEQFYAYLCAD